MANIAGLERLIEPEVKGLGYELVRVMMIGGACDPTLQVMAERPDTGRPHRLSQPSAGPLSPVSSASSIANGFHAGFRKCSTSPTQLRVATASK